MLNLGFVAGAEAAAETKASGKVEWGRTVEAAVKEGKISIYGATGSEIRTALTEGFAKAFPGIKLEYFPLEGGPLVARVIAEQKAQRYDVDVIMTGASTAVRLLKPQGALDPLKPALVLPEVTNGKSWIKGGADFYDREQQVNVAFFGFVKSPLVVNTVWSSLKRFKASTTF